MKYVTLLIGLLALSPTLSFGQDSKASVQLQSAEKENEEKKLVVTAPKPVMVPKPASEISGKKVSYGGYLVNVAQTEKKRSLFSLRAPLDPQKDFENVSYSPGTNKVQGIILFSIKF